MSSRKMSDPGKTIETASPASKQAGAKNPQPQKIPVVDFSVGDDDENSPWQEYGQVTDYCRCDDDQDHILEWDPVTKRFLAQSILRAREELEQARVQQAKVTNHGDKDTGAEAKND